MQDLFSDDILYKYLPCRRKDYLDKKEKNYQLLRFTQPRAFNDPFECLPGLSQEQAATTMQRFHNHHQAGKSSVESKGFAKKKMVPIREVRPLPCLKLIRRLYVD